MCMALMYSAGGAWALPNCTGYDATTWTQCVGEFKWMGDHYTGEWVDGLVEGQGALTFASGDTYVGGFKDGLKNGQGTLTSGNSTTYVGEFKDGKKNGQGTFTFLSSLIGFQYVGEFQNDQRHGQGSLSSKSGGKYVGGWSNGNRDGFGTNTFANGDKYIGGYNNGKFDGQGTFTLVNGDKYIGAFQNDKRNGQGALTYANGDKYIGAFKDDVLHGEGTYTFASGDKYVGKHQNSEFDVQGTLTLADGGTYVGEFRRREKNGKGVLTYANGDKYVGEFKDDVRHGEGTYTFANGDKYVGGHQNGEFWGQGTLSSANGGTYVGEFLYGRKAELDCAKAATETERAICSDAILSIDDRVLSYIFQRRLALRAEGKVWNEERQRWSDTTSKILTENEAVAEQKAWLNGRDLCAGDIKCLQNSYNERINVTLETVKLNSSTFYIQVPTNIKDTLRFTAALIERKTRERVIQLLQSSQRFVEIFYYKPDEIRAYPVIAAYPDNQIVGPSDFKLQDLFKVIGVNSPPSDTEVYEIDYKLLNQCLDKLTLSDFNWYGDWAAFSSMGISDCISFYWAEGYTSDALHGKESKFVLLPFVKSPFIREKPPEVLNLNCDDKSLKDEFSPICTNQVFKDMYQNLFKYGDSLISAGEITMEDMKVNQQNLLYNLLNCGGDYQCISDHFATGKAYQTISRKIQKSGENNCGFADDGVFTCFSSKACIVNNTMLQFSRLNKEQYELKVWQPYWKYKSSASGSGSQPTTITKGKISGEGTNICAHAVYVFENGITLTPDLGCYGDDPIPRSIMTYVGCDKSNGICEATSSGSKFCISLE